MGSSRKSCVLLVLVAACGQKQDFEYGEELDPARLGGSGAAQTEGEASTSYQQTTKPGKTYQIVPVTQIVSASSGIPSWTQADLPFTGNPVQINQSVTDGQTPIYQKAA